MCFDSNSRYDNHSPPSTTARNGSTDDTEINRNGSQKDDHDNDAKPSNNVSINNLDIT